MDKIYEELDNAKAEIENLKTENRAKGALSETLKRANDKQLAQIQEISKELERQRQESYEKDHEMSEMKQVLEDLKSSLNEKQGILLRVSHANDKLRTSHAEEVRKYEEEKKELVFKLEEENAKNIDSEKKIRRLEEAIEGLKGVVSVSQKKCAGAEAEEMGKASLEVRYRDDILLKVEEENRELKDLLKIKREQFEHLKEAHQRLRDQLHLKNKEWDKEKSMLLDEIDKLQDNLDSQTRITKDLQSRLQMCNQALAHECSRRKSLELQLLESKTWFDNVSTECIEAKSKLECQSDKGDEDIVTLRDLLGTKEVLYKELEYKTKRLEQDNQELKSSLKEYQEAQIKQAGSSSSVSKLRNKLKCLEQTHTDCSAKLKIKEGEWISEKEKLMNDLNHWRSEDESKGELIKELNLKLEGCHSLIMQLMMQIEESSIMLLVLQSEIKEAQLKFGDEKADIEKENYLSFLQQQLEMKDGAIVAALDEVEEEHRKVESLSRRIESFNLIEEQKLALKKDLDHHKKMAVDSFTCQQHLKEQVLQLTGDLNRVYDALDVANEELAQKFCEAKEAEYEIQTWESIAEQLKNKMEENYQLRKEVEASLLEQVSVEVTLEQEKEDMVHLLEEKDGRINHLLQKVQSMEEELKLREAVAQISEEKDRKIGNLQSEIVSLDQKLMISEQGAGLPARNAQPQVKKDCSILEREIEWWDNEWLGKELESTICAQFDAQRVYEHKNKKLHQLVDEKSQKISEFHKHISSLEQEFENSTSSFSSLLVKLQAETNLFHDIQEKFTTTVVLKELELQYKNLLIAELENDSSNLQQKLELQEKSLSTSIQKRDDSITEAEVELFERFSELYDEDMQLAESLGHIVQRINDNRKVREFKDSEDFFDPVKENLIMSTSPMQIKIEKPVFMIPSSPSTDGRSPLRTLN